MILLLKSYPYHFVRTILSVPFCPIPFCPYTILSISFCPYHFVRYHFVLEPKIPYKTRKRSMTKKRSQKFWEIDVEFLGECRHFFGKCLKKVVKKCRKKIKFGPPVSEGLDPLVSICMYVNPIGRNGVV